MLKKIAKNRSTKLLLRPFIQGFFFIFFIVLFIKVSYPYSIDITHNFFFNLDPLIVLVMALSGTLFISALLFSVVVVCATVVFGRVFCGWICPLGTLLDLTVLIVPHKKIQRPFGIGRYINIKYYILVFLFVGALVSFSVGIFFDPLVILFRFFTLNVYPYIITTANFFLDMVRPLALRVGFDKLSTVAYAQPVFFLGTANLLIFLTIVGLLWIEQRFWCRNLCPLGGLLSLLSRYPLWRRRVSDDCISCTKCAQTCPTNAIGEDFKKTSLRECIQCERCKDVCPVNAITFGFLANEIQQFEVNPQRRTLLLSACAGVTAGLSARSLTATKTTNGKLIRPPGAHIESDFLDACLRCGECMKVCPTHGLQPSIFESGLEGFSTPILVPRIGGCEERCNLCGQVCPTGAIRRLPLEEKQYAVIGNALIDRTRCIAWEQLKLCLICDEVCPYDAVEFRMVTDEKGTLQRPFVIEDKCTGCGQCEHACPVNGPAAIYVTPINEVRKNSGSYITDKVKRLREVQDEGKDFYRGYNMQEQRSNQSGPVEPDDEEEIPPGFTK